MTPTIERYELENMLSYQYRISSQYTIVLLENMLGLFTRHIGIKFEIETEEVLSHPEAFFEE